MICVLGKNTDMYFICKCHGANVDKVNTHIISLSLLHQACFFKLVKPHFMLLKQV